MSDPRSSGPPPDATGPPPPPPLSPHAAQTGALVRAVQDAIRDSVVDLRADVTYEELAAKLREHGFEETKISVANKLSRGTFPATFFVAVMKAIGAQQVRLEDI